MGKAWDGSGVAFDVNLWQECLRVLRPGGYLLAFGGSRTYHRMACAIEDAGFILHPMIGWVQGQGFPKATNLGKMLDKSVGAERAISGKAHGHIDSNGVHDDDNYVWERVYDRKDIPVTPEATQWDGWYYGRQSLKPALEPICMAQKPPEGRMVDNIRAWVCGGINVDGCRIGAPIPYTQGGWHHDHTINDDGWAGGIQETRNPAGRFPANLILSHSPNCVKVGRKKIKGISGGNSKAMSGLYKMGMESNNPDGQRCGYGDATGHEEIDDYVCSEDCPVRLMGEQSGICKSGAKKRIEVKNAQNGVLNGGKGFNTCEMRIHGDKTVLEASSGSAARFFLNIEPEPFFYCPKASSSERNFGLDGTCTVKLITDNDLIKRSCQKDVNTVAVQLLQKVTSDLGVLKWSIAESGESILALCQLGSLSTTSTAISKIIESRTLDSLIRSLTNESTPGVNSSMVNGGSLAENVENLKEWLLTITNEKMELALGASRVALKMLSQTSEKESWQTFKNFHSTVKPLKLMRYLCRLITPPGGLILDPFAGSGTTLCAAKLEGFEATGIELNQEYITIAEARLAAYKPDAQTAFQS